MAERENALGKNDQVTDGCSGVARQTLAATLRGGFVRAVFQSS